jgi:hypothetical protein
MNWNMHGLTGSLFAFSNLKRKSIMNNKRQFGDKQHIAFLSRFEKSSTPDDLFDQYQDNAEEPTTVLPTQEAPTDPSDSGTAGTEAETRPDIQPPTYRVQDRVIIRRGTHIGCVATITGIDEGIWFHVDIPHWEEGEKGLITVPETYKADEIEPALPMPDPMPDVKKGDIVLTITGIQDAIGKEQEVKGITVYKVNGHRQWYPQKDLQLIKAREVADALRAAQELPPSPFGAPSAPTGGKAVNTETDAAQVLKLQRQIEQMEQQLNGASLGALNELKSWRDRAQKAEGNVRALEAQLVDADDRAQTAQTRLAKYLGDLRQAHSLNRSLEQQLIDQPVEMGTTSLVEVKQVIYNIALNQPEHNRGVDNEIAKARNQGWNVAHETVLMDGLVMANRIIRYERTIRTDPAATPTTTAAAAPFDAFVETLDMHTPEHIEIEDAELVPVNDGQPPLDLDTMTVDQASYLYITGVIELHEYQQVSRRHSECVLRRSHNPYRSSSTPTVITTAQA